jgi:hypothetical protein
VKIRQEENSKCEGYRAQKQRDRLQKQKSEQVEIKGKAIPLQAWTGPEGSRTLRLPVLKKIST